MLGSTRRGEWVARGGCHPGRRGERWLLLLLILRQMRRLLSSSLFIVVGLFGLGVICVKINKNTVYLPLEETERQR